MGVSGELGRRDGSIREEGGVGIGEIMGVWGSVEGTSTMVLGERSGVDGGCVGHVKGVDSMDGDWGGWEDVVINGELGRWSG